MNFKKAIAVILSAALIIVSLAFGMLSAYAVTTKITDSALGNELVDTTSGYDDKVTYVFVPTTSGVYTFYGLKDNPYATEAYLFLKTEDSDGKKFFTQLAYSNSNPDYANYPDSSRRQFCLTYHLIAGEMYYYYAGWNSEDRAGSISTKLICEMYDTSKLVSITPSCSAELTWYTDGSWETDDAGEAYYLYNISKIVQNMSLTLVFDDGTTLTSRAGDTTVSGYPITYTHNQQEVHWYNADNDNYTANTLNITVLGKTVAYEVVINQSALLTVTGKVIDDYSGDTVSGAKLSIANNAVATTKSDGTFSFNYSAGSYNVTVEGDGIVSRTFMLKVDAVNVGNNNHTATPITVVSGDYVGDDVINGKDYAYIKTNITGSDLIAAKTKFSKYMGFCQNDYESLSL